MSRIMDTGDVVLHKPTGERWLVAYVAQGGEHLVCCGWPESSAKVSDCELIVEASPDERQRLLWDLASMSGSDSRKAYAQLQLKKAEEILPKEY